MARSTTSGTAPGNGTKPTKTEAVLALLGEGLSSPSQIANEVLARYGITISPAHVSNIKSKSGIKTGRRRKGRRGRKAKAAVDNQTQKAAAPGRPGAGLTASDLDALLHVAKRMGGLRELRNYLDLLGRFQP
jgi:hypothetical protein